MDRPTPSDVMPKRDHERDLELDKKIEALRRKNEALMKRYKEVEEDKKRAEEEGMALQSRKGKADDLTITISKSTSDSRVVVTKPFSGGAPAGKGQPEAGPERGDEGPPPGTGRGHKRQLTVTMAGKKGKRVVSERPEKRPGPADVKSPAEEGQAKRAESAGRGKPPPLPPPPSHNTTKKDAAAQDEVKQGQKHSEEHHRLSEELESPQAGTDLNIPTSKEEQEEYLRWKKERDQIDRERVARHKNAKGQWRRAWDVDKTENMFTDKSLPDRDWGPPSRGGRNARRGQHRQNADSRGHEKRGKDKGAKNVLVVGSKAKGKDRLTGRARRWQDNEEGDNPQTGDATLEDFLEELDALTDAEAEDQREPDPKAKSSPSPDSMSASEEARDPAAPGSAEDAATATPTAPAQGKADTSPPRAAEKKVRFSEELVQVAPPPSLSPAKTSSPKKNKCEAPLPEEDAEVDGPRDQREADPAEAECTKKEAPPPAAPAPPPAERACAPVRDSSPPVELTKCSISNANSDELIDSGLSVLSLESGEAHPAHPTSSDKAREHGKIV